MIATLRMGLGMALFIFVTVILVVVQCVVRIMPHCNGALLARLWHQFVLGLLGVRVATAGHMSTARPLLLVSNHISWVDVMVLGSLAGVRFIAKSDIGSWPVIGWLARKQDTVFVDRSARLSSTSQVQAITSRLSGGETLVLFAEGTSGDGHRVLPFNSTLFAAVNRPACEKDVRSVTVQPVAIIYTRLGGVPMGRHCRRRVAFIGTQPLLPHIMEMLRHGAVDAEVHFGTPIPAAGLSRKSIARMAEDEVRAMMISAVRYVSTDDH